MGLEDFGVRFRASHGLRLEVSAIAATLVNGLGFQPDPPSLVRDAAQLAAPELDRSTFTLSHPGGIIEAELLDRPGWHPSLSVRMAICQPPYATDLFLKVVRELSCKHDLEILCDRIEFAPDSFEAFRTRAQSEIAEMKARWRDMFDGDSEELSIPTSRVWAYFLDKHPAMRLPARSALAPHTESE